jgi:hypothetical protein
MKMAVTWTRTLRAAPGKQAEARQWALEITAHVNSLNAGEVHLHVARFGDMTQVGWSVASDSLAQLEERQAKYLADETYLKMAADVQARGLFDGSINDQVWDTLV